MKNIKLLAAVEGILFGVALFFLALDRNGGPEGWRSRRLYYEQSQDYHRYEDGTIESMAKELGDLVGYLTVDGTSIDYPVMRDRTDSEGNFFYLTHNYLGEKDPSGCPFIRRSVRLDDDIVEVFAHNNSNGTMFADLVNFENEEFFSEYGQVILDTVEGRRIYEVAAVLDVDVSGEDYTFWGWHNFPDSETEGQFISQVVSSARIVSPEMLNGGDQYLLLVTCEYSHANGRRIIVAVRTA